MEDTPALQNLLELMHTLAQFKYLRFKALKTLGFHCRQLYRMPVSISSSLMHPIFRQGVRA